MNSSACDYCEELRNSVKRIEQALMGSLDKEDTGFIPKVNRRLLELEEFKKTILRINWLIVAAFISCSVVACVSFIKLGVK